MKNTAAHFLAKLISTMPIEAIRKSNRPEPRVPQSRLGSFTAAKDETLNRIFMVRYRTQHL